MGNYNEAHAGGRLVREFDVRSASITAGAFGASQPHEQLAEDGEALAKVL